MKFKVTNPKVWEAVCSKDMPMKDKIKVYEKMGGAYRLGEDGGEQVFNKMTDLLKHKANEINEEAPINSNGGDLTSAIALIDVMKNSNVPIRTIGVGAVISAAFFIFAAGTKGERFIGRNTSIMCHQYSTNAEGKHHDLKAYGKEMELTNKKMLNLLKEFTDLDLKAIKSKSKFKRNFLWQKLPKYQRATINSFPFKKSIPK